MLTWGCAAVDEFCKRALAAIRPQCWLQTGADWWIKGQHKSEIKRMRDKERAGCYLMEERRRAAHTDTVSSPHLMLHLAETQNKPIPSAALLTDTQSFWSHIRTETEQAQNRHNSCDITWNMRGYISGWDSYGSVQHVGSSDSATSRWGARLTLAKHTAALRDDSKWFW